MTSQPQPALVHHSILAHATLRPRALAVIAGRQRLSYAVLASRVAVVARMLAAEGVGPDQVVGLHTPRSVDGLVGLLGILTAGGAWLYLDPTLPGDQHTRLADTAGMRVVLDCTQAPTLLHPLPRIRVGRRSGDQPAPRLRLRRTAPDLSRPGDLAYVACTFGGTDPPPAVAVEHAGVANLTRQLAAVLDLCPGRRSLQYAGWSRDTFTAEVLTPLATGATIVLAPDTARHDPARLADKIRRHRVDTVTLPPTVLHRLPADELSRLRTVVAVDAACPPDLAGRWASPGRRLFTSYSITEAGGTVSIGICHAGDDVHNGAPLPGVLIRVVDDTGRPVPTGQPGQLLVGGAGVARGYLGANPTDARFLRDPDGTRWLCTSDQVRQRSDGTLIHLGSLDQQTHTHGNRVSGFDTTPHRHTDIPAGRTALLAAGMGCQPSPASCCTGGFR